MTECNSGCRHMGSLFYPESSSVQGWEEVIIGNQVQFCGLYMTQFAMKIDESNHTLTKFKKKCLCII